MAYYCSKCKRNHRSGKIYEKHKHLQIKQEKEEIPFDNVIEYNPNDLRNIAKLQISRYLTKIKNNPECRKMYTQAINQVILYEREQNL